MKTIHLLSGIQVLSIEQDIEYIVTGSGSVFTYQCTGQAGQSALVQGSIDGTIWSDLVSFTIESNGQVLSKVKQHTFPTLKISGNAQVLIARGNA